MRPEYPENDIIRHVIAAAATASWDELKLLLHPYLHWSEGDGETLRGRTNVLRWLASRHEPLLPPSRFELRDGQVYRWNAGSRTR